MWRLRLVPTHTDIGFMRLRYIAFAVTVALVLGSVAVFMVRGLNQGIDFAGGIVIEVRTGAPADLGAMRSAVSQLGLGEVALQEFGAANDVLIRVQRQEGEQAAQEAAADQVREALRQTVDSDVTVRRVEFVGPKVSGELVRAAIEATVLAMIAMMIYIWFRFEWQYGVGAMVTIAHDVILTMGFFAVTGLEFNLTSVAAILTIVGYSINDTVVVYDRVRENLRKYKTMPLDRLIDVSINDTLSRTAMTGATTLLALIALLVFGGEVLRSFIAAMIFGIAIGIYSSVFVAAPLLIHLRLKRGEREAGAEAAAAKAP